MTIDANSTGSSQSTGFAPNGGHALNGHALNGHIEEPIAMASHLRNPKASPEDARTIQTVRGIVVDCVEQYENGHGGSALGMAAIATVLWRHILRFDPSKSDWFDRDRIVFSNGHVSLLQYIMLHLSGYPSWTIEQLKGFGHPSAVDNTCQARMHPEMQYEALDMSTGPLGQGIANAVGMAMANMNLRQKFNRENFEVIKARVYCVCGDACLQEGVALEAISLAGHLKLDNLIVIYDNNGVQCDGLISLTISDDVNAKMRACGWHVLEVPDGNFNAAAVKRALEHAQDFTGQPVFLNIKTVIGLGTSRAGTHHAHENPFGLEDVAKCKEAWNLDPAKTHQIGEDVLQYWAQVPEQGKFYRRQWEQLLSSYEQQYPDLAKSLQSRIKGHFERSWKMSLASYEPSRDKISMLEASAAIYDYLWPMIPFFTGSADLLECSGVTNAEGTVFGSRETGKLYVNFASTYVHYGVREHGMIAIANGIAAYSKRAFLPVTSTLSAFQLYGAAALRMSALCELQVIHIGTHDSIEAGTFGPTHQAVETMTLFRATPGLLHVRPADTEETVGAWMMAVEYDGPTAIGLNSENVPQLVGTDRHRMQKGAYTLFEDSNSRVTLVSTGSDIWRVVEVADILRKESIPCRMVSMPSMRRFEEQDEEYIRSVIPWDGRPIVSVEAGSTLPWPKFASASIGQEQFGVSMSAGTVMDHFKLTSHHIFTRVKAYLKETGDKDVRMMPWRMI